MSSKPSGILFRRWGQTLLTLLSLLQQMPTTLTTTASPSETGDVDLYFMGLVPYSGAWHGGKSIMAAAQLGVDMINNRSDILPGYKLHIVQSDTKCDPGVGVKVFTEQIYTPPQKIMILGAACSIVSETIARAAHHWNLVQVSYTSSSPTLSDKSQFPKFARSAAPDTSMNPARIQFFQDYGWNRIATIHQLHPLFAETTEDLTAKLHELNFTIIRSEIFQEDPAVQVRNLKEHDCRIIVGAFYEDKARKVFCEAYKQGLYGRRVVWLIYGWYVPGWWQDEDPSVDCTPEQLGQAVEGAFSTSMFFLNPYPDRSISGWLPTEFVEAYKERVNGSALYGEHVAPQAFDAVWLMALALNDTMKSLREMGSNKSLEDFTYEDKVLADLLYSSLLNVSFMGVKGPIALNQYGDAVGLVKISRIQGGKSGQVGLYKPIENRQFVLDWLEDNPVIWKGGSPPRDSTVTREVFVTLSVPLYATMCVLAALGVLLAVGFLAFNLVKRHVKIVKMSSPRINNVILLGCVLSYCSVLVQDAGGAHGEIGCEAKTALLSLGVSMTFGALFAKTWRVHVIFTNNKLQKKVLSDVQLFAILGVLVGINVVVLVTWWVVDPRALQVIRVTSVLEEDVAGEVLIRKLERSCVSEHQLYFLGTLYGIHAIVLLFGVFLAWETRKVHYPELNDSKYIGMCIYNVALLCIPGVVVGIAIDTGVNLSYAVESALVLLGTTVTQCLIFVPKVMGYHQNQVDPEDTTKSRTRDFPTVTGTGSMHVNAMSRLQARLPEA